MLAKKKRTRGALVLHCDIGSLGNQTRAMDEHNRLPAAFHCIRPPMRRRSGSRNKIKFPLFHAGNFEPVPNGRRFTSSFFASFRYALGLLPNIHKMYVWNLIEKIYGSYIVKGVLGILERGPRMSPRRRRCENRVPDVELIKNCVYQRRGGLVMSLTWDTLTQIEGTITEALFERGGGQVPAKGWRR